MKKIICVLAALALAFAAIASAEGDYAFSSETEAYVGLWASDKALMNIEPSGEAVSVTVVEDDGVTGRVEWSYEDVTYDEVADELNCMEIGVKTRTTYDEYMAESEAELLFDDGAAAFRFDDNGALVWVDYKEAPGGETAFRRVAELPDAYEGMWVAEDGAVLFITDMGGYAHCVVWSADEAYRWVYGVAVYDEDADGLSTLATGVKTHTVVDPETVEYTTYEHEYTDGKAFFGFDIDGRLAWVEDWNSDAPTVMFERMDFDDLDGDGLHASIQPVTDSPEWIVNLPAAQDENTRQLFVVAGMGMDATTATISMHERDEDGHWQQILSTPGFVGRNGLCLDADHAEGCGQTPIGVYGFNKAFGIAEDPGCAIPYIQVDDSTYWSGDEEKAYNEMVDIGDYPDLDMENSEHIVDYEYQYQYCLNISFNDDGTPGRGSAIFLHCFGPAKPYTGGCVAIPENIMKLVMQNVVEDCVVVIDTFENMGGSF